MDRVERGQPQATPQMQGYADLFRSQLEEIHPRFKEARAQAGTERRAADAVRPRRAPAGPIVCPIGCNG